MFQAPADQEPPQPDIKDVPWRELTKPAEPKGDSQDDVLQSFLDDVKEDPPGQSREGLPGSPRLNKSRASMLGLVTKVNFQEGEAVEVWSGKEEAWCVANVLSVEGHGSTATVTVAMKLPDGTTERQRIESCFDGIRQEGHESEDEEVKAFRQEHLIEAEAAAECHKDLTSGPDIDMGKRAEDDERGKRNKQLAELKFSPWDTKALLAPITEECGPSSSVGPAHCGRDVSQSAISSGDWSVQIEGLRFARLHDEEEERKSEAPSPQPACDINVKKEDQRLHDEWHAARQRLHDDDVADSAAGLAEGPPVARYPAVSVGIWQTNAVYYNHYKAKHTSYTARYYSHPPNAMRPPGERILHVNLNVYEKVGPVMDVFKAPGRGEAEGLEFVVLKVPICDRTRHFPGGCAYVNAETKARPGGPKNFWPQVHLTWKDGQTQFDDSAERREVSRTGQREALRCCTAGASS